MNKVTLKMAFVSGMVLFGATLSAQTAFADTLPLSTPCQGTSLRVEVAGFRDRVGNLRVQVYGKNAEDFLESGKKVVRVEGRVSPSGSMNVCVPLPGPGTYAVVALHDRDSDGRLSVRRDGFGFSRNPKLGFSKPAHDKVKITVPSGTTDVRIVLNYVQGLSARPIKNAD